MIRFLPLLLAACYDPATIPDDVPAGAESCVSWQDVSIDVVCDEMGIMELAPIVGELPPTVERCAFNASADNYECFTNDEGGSWGRVITYRATPDAAADAMVITCDLGEYEWRVTRHGCS